MLPKPQPFENYGASCWYNSAMQALLSSSNICRQLSEESRNSTMKMFKAIYEKPDGNSLMTLFVAYARKYRAQGQQDSHEGLLHFLDMANATFKKTFMVNYKIYIHCKACDHTQNSPEWNSNSYVSIDLACSNMRDYILCHTMDIDADFVCKNCKVAGKCEQIYKLAWTPEVIICLFPKYNGKTLYDFPNTFDIRKKGGGAHKYHLISQIEHSGSMSGGHYSAVGQRADGIYVLNDSSITPASFKSTPNTYLAIYERAAD